MLFSSTHLEKVAVTVYGITIGHAEHILMEVVLFNPEAAIDNNSSSHIFMSGIISVGRAEYAWAKLNVYSPIKSTIIACTNMRIYYLNRLYLRNCRSIISILYIRNWTFPGQSRWETGAVSSGNKSATAAVAALLNGNLIYSQHVHFTYKRWYAVIGNLYAHRVHL